MPRISRALDWLTDVGIPSSMLAAMLAGWIVVVVVLALTSPWWAPVAAAVLGIPFLAVVSGEVLSRD